MGLILMPYIQPNLFFLMIPFSNILNNSPPSMKLWFGNIILVKVNILMLFFNKLMNLKHNKKSKLLKVLLKGKEQDKKALLKILNPLKMNLHGLVNCSIEWTSWKPISTLDLINWMPTLLIFNMISTISMSNKAIHAPMFIHLLLIKTSS